MVRHAIVNAGMRQSWKPAAIDGAPDGLVLFDGVCVLCSGWVHFLIERDRAFKADSAIHALSRLPRWRWVRAFSVLPRPVRNWFYDRIARNRYQLFGRTESCMVPTPELMRRFIFEHSSANPERPQP
jgi:predicted DCC family thiol-disulfide oxidoreductase YuxK